MNVDDVVTMTQAAQTAVAAATEAGLAEIARVVVAVVVPCFIS